MGNEPTRAKLKVFFIHESCLHPLDNTAFFRNNFDNFTGFDVAIHDVIEKHIHFLTSLLVVEAVCVVENFSVHNGNIGVIHGVRTVAILRDELLSHLITSIEMETINEAFLRERHFEHFHAAFPGGMVAVTVIGVFTADDDRETIAVFINGVFILEPHAAFSREGISHFWTPFEF